MTTIAELRKDYARDSLDEAIDIAKQIGRDEKVVFEIRPVRLFLPKG